MIDLNEVYTGELVLISIKLMNKAMIRKIDSLSFFLQYEEAHRPANLDRQIKALEVICERLSAIEAEIEGIIDIF